MGNRNSVLRRNATPPSSIALTEGKRQEAVPTRFTEFDKLGFPTQDIVDVVTPPWQHDIGNCAASKVSPVRERQLLLRSVFSLGQTGVIIDTKCRVIDGTPGWSLALQALGSLNLENGRVRIVSPVCQSQFAQAVDQIIVTQCAAKVSVMLRDLDGWGSDIVQLLPVGEANPSLVVLLLPKSPTIISSAFEDLSRTLSLTRCEFEVGKMVMQGCVDQEMATAMGQDVITVRQILKSVLRKFGVRRRSDFVGLFARLP